MPFAGGPAVLFNFAPGARCTLPPRKRLFTARPRVPRAPLPPSPCPLLAYTPCYGHRTQPLAINPLEPGAGGGGGRALLKRGGGSCNPKVQKFVYQKQPKSIFPFVKILFFPTMKSGSEETLRR